MSNTIRKSILGATATAALVFAPVGAVAMADDVVDSPATNEVTEEVESIDSSDAAATDDSVEAEVIEEAPATEDTDTETEVVEEQSAPQEDSEPVKAEDTSSQPAQEGSDSQESTPEKAQPKSDAESKSQKKTVVQDDSSTSTTSSDDTPDVISDQEDDSEPPVEDDGSEEGDDGSEEDSFTNVAYNHRTDHQNQVLFFDILYEYSEANDTTGWKIDLMTFDENRNPIMVAEGVQLPPAGETLSFSLAEYGPGIYNWYIYYKSHDNMTGGFSTKLLVPATPVGPTQDKEGQKLIIPEDDNFDYSYTNAGMTVPIGSGTHWIGPVGEVVVTAKIKPGEVVDQNATTEWTFNFVESGNTGGDDGDDGDDNTPEVTVITPDKSWVEHIKNPGQNDDQAEVRGDYQDKVLVATVEHHDGRVDVVLVPGDGYAFPDDADEVTISFPEFVDAGNGDDDDDDTPEVTVITPDNGWLEHIQKPGKGDDQFEVKDEFADKVTIIMVDSDNAEPGKVNVVVMPNDGYVFPDEAASHTLTYDEFVKPVDSGDDDDNSNGGGDNDNGNGDSDVDGGTNNGSSDDNDGTDGTKDDDSDDSDSDSKGGDGSKDDSNDNVDDKNSAKTDDKSDGKGGSDQSGKKDSSGKDGKSGQAGDGDDKLNQGFSADTGVDEPLTFAPVAGAALIVAAAAGAMGIRRYRLQ